MSKKPINEINLTKFMGSFFQNIQRDSQKRFIKQAKEKGMPPKIVTKLTKVENEIKELEALIKEYS